MVEAITTVANKETTTTTINLKYPPLFEGVSIEITQYSQSPKDLNVTFHNLTPDARVLIEMGDNQAMLRQNLIDKGYTLQLLTIESDVRSDRGGIITAKSDAETRGGQGDRFGSKKEGDRGKEDNRFG
jgi:hypothetical protein